MTPDYLKAVARFVRDLLNYDENLISFDHTEEIMADKVTSYIVVNSSNVADKLSSGRAYDGDAEIMTYSNSYQQPIILEFYGENAYTNASDFSLLSDSEKARKLKRQHGISISRVSTSTDVKKLLGYQFGNRVDIEFNINYAPTIDVETLRIDTVPTEFTED